MRVVVLVSAAVLGLLGAATESRAAQFVNEGTWASVLAAPGLGPLQVIEFPATAYTGYGGHGDAPPRYRPMISDAPATGPGQWSGTFGCASNAYPCDGVNRLVYTLPQPVLGLSGRLNYYSGAGFGFGMDFFDAALIGAAARSPYRYEGFFGMLFDAPTSVIDIRWICAFCSDRSILSFDDQALFTLSGAQALIAAPATDPPAVPEPGGMALVLSGLIGLGLLGRRPG